MGEARAKAAAIKAAIQKAGEREGWTDSFVDCDGCTACCRGQMVALLPGDDFCLSHMKWHTEYSPVTNRPERVLNSKPNGDCVYLKDGACSIYDKRPQMCRSFSCVRLCKKIIAAYPNRAERRRLGKSGILDKEIMRAGFQRLGEGQDLLSDSKESDDVR